MSERQVVLDTETTGLEAAEGHRIVEIGCVELRNRRPTGVDFHHYVNPERPIDSAALGVHGITTKFLADKPRFTAIAASLVDYLRGAEVIIHNAAFDVGFLDMELERAGRPERIADLCTVVDSLALAKQLHPGQRNSLDALCKRYDVNNQHREMHGALLDARLLTDVYLAMTGGQSDLVLERQEPRAERRSRDFSAGSADGELVVHRANDAELAAHRERLEAMARKRPVIWQSELEAESP